jgi:hypothetical protein
VLGTVDDDFFPDRAAAWILEIMDLVQDDDGDSIESPRIGIDHVAEHLGGHDDDFGVSIDDVVPGEETNSMCAVPV